MIPAATVPEVRVCGVGLLSGAETQITLQRLSPQEYRGVRWFEQTDPQDFDWQAQRSTVLTHRSGTTLFTPEHLSAAALGWPHCGTALQTQHGDIPILDGSAREWVESLRALHGNPSTALSLYNAPLSAESEFPGGYWQVQPSRSGCLDVEYSLERLQYRASVCLQLQSFPDLDPVLSARTFIFEPEYEESLRRGLLPGAREGCGLLLRGRGDATPEVLSGAPLRNPVEPVLHKILDLLGDLALLGPFLPKLHIRIHNGGHVSHHQILTRLLPYVHS